MTLNKPGIDTSSFSKADWKRIVDYVDLLITIDRQRLKEASAKEVPHD